MNISEIFKEEYGHIRALECAKCLNEVKIGLAVMTEHKCIMCGRPMMFETNNVNQLCNVCALQSNKCRVCGGEK